MQSYSGPLLATGEGGDLAPRRRRRHLKVAVIVLGLAAGMLAAYTLIRASVPQKSTKKAPMVMMNSTVSMSEVSAQKHCWKFTGGSCYMFGCHADRGPTDCTDHACLCQAGYCSSTDGKCYHHHNHLIASGFRLHLKKWPSYSMYAAGCETPDDNNKQHGGKMKVASYHVGRRGTFSLYKLPQVPEESAAYILVAEEYPTCVVNVDTKEHCEESSDDKKETTCHQDPQAVNEPMGGIDLQSVGLRVHVQKHHGRQYIAIEDNFETGKFMYVPEQDDDAETWLVKYQDFGDDLPDSQGLWHPHPEIHHLDDE